VSWLLLGLGFLAGVGGGLVTGPLWSVFAVVIVLLGLIPPVAYRSRYVMLPWEVLAMAALPLIGIALGAQRLSSQFVSYLAIAAVGLVIVVELDSFTSIRMSPGFAIVLVVAATMAASALWAMLEWYAAIFFDQSFTLTNDELMIEFIYAALAGVIGGVLFRTYFRRYVSASKRVPKELEETIEEANDVDA
jgi:dolichyl-phosphate-mannose--protein O-mannosyl transferase